MQPLSRFKSWLQRLPNFCGVALLSALLVVTLQPQIAATQPDDRPSLQAIQPQP